MEIQFGALVPTLAQQFEDAGTIPVDYKAVFGLQQDADAITRCLVKGFIPHGAARTARKRLMKRIASLELEPSSVIGEE